MAKRLGEALLGKVERRALRRIVAESAEAATDQFPGIAAVSVDIDLLGAASVADELLDASVPGTVPRWEIARARWREVYGEEMNANGEGFLSALAHEIRPRLQRSQVLQGLWTARTLERQSDSLETTGLQLTELIASVDGLTDPLAAITKKRGEIGSDMEYAMSVANALGAAIASGSVGKGVDLRIRGETGDVELVGRPGVDVRVSFTKLVPNSEQGRAELAQLDEALKTGNPVEVGEVVNVAMTVDGQAVAIPPTANVVISRATRPLRILIDLEGEGVDPVRLLLAGDSFVENGKLYFTAKSSNYGAIRVDLSVDIVRGEATQTTTRFYVADEVPFTLAHQVVLQRVFASLGRGGRITVDFVDPPIARGVTTLEPQSDLADAFDAVEPLAKVNELQQMLGLDLPALDVISGEDHALVIWAIELVRKGEAKVAASGEFTLSGDRAMADQLRRDADDRGQLSIRQRLAQYGIDFGGGVHIELGPVDHHIQGAQLVGPVETEPGVWEAKIAYTAENPQTMKRVTAETPTADSDKTTSA